MAKMENRGIRDMNTEEQIAKYISAQPQSKRDELRLLHQFLLKISPNCKLRFLDGRNSEDKVVSNPNIGYGSKSTEYANGEIGEFYQIGLSANTTGISVYIMGIDDKNYLPETYGKRLGKAKVTGYCIKFRSITDVHLDVLEEIFRNHLDVSADAAV
jgi:uncharacterized protein YdhG (YjbR/CyaY superfamily)